MPLLPLVVQPLLTLDRSSPKRLFGTAFHSHDEWSSGVRDQ
jgi:hypothetical protein